MKVNTQQHIEKSPAEVFRIISDFGYWVGKVDPDVLSMVKQTEGPIGVDTKWIETMKVPGSTAVVDVWITAIDPGNSVSVEFDNKMMKGYGTFTVKAADEGADLTQDVHASVKPGLGWLFYPMIRMDFPKRERKRLAEVKRLTEAGVLDAAHAEQPAGAAPSDAAAEAPAAE